ncbi:MAG: histidine kinase [Thermoanaerobacteraceae bacterium]|nr:histidine kinase [Thermoanaerobacteraceae bacterium]
MIYKDLITLIIIFVILLTIGVRIAEKGLYDTMGLDLRPKSFDFDFQSDRVYSFTVFGNSLKLQKYYRIGDIFAHKGHLSLVINGKKISINSLVPTGFFFMERLNLDKKSANMYN